MACTEVEGAPFFLGQPAKNGWESPTELGITSARVELFCDEPDALIARALEGGAKGSLDPLQNHERPWGNHRQGGFTDPFGHIWLEINPHSFVPLTHDHSVDESKLTDAYGETDAKRIPGKSTSKLLSACRRLGFPKPVDFWDAEHSFLMSAGRRLAVP